MITEKIFNKFDQSGTHYITRDEFLCGIAYFCKVKDQDEIIMNVFQLLYHSDNTHMSKHEFIIFLNIFPQVTHILSKQSMSKPSTNSINEDDEKIIMQNFQTKTE